MRKLAIAILLVPALAQAGGYAIPDTVPRDLAMGDALVAAQDSSAAAYRNPASLSRLSGLDINLSPGILGNGATWNPPAGTSYSTWSTDFKAAYPVAAFASWSGRVLDRGYGIGVGFNIPGGGNVNWPNLWPGGYAIETVNLRVYGSYLTAGVELIPQIRIGGGVVYYYASEQLSKYAYVPGPSNPANCPPLPSGTPAGSCGLANVADSGGQVSWDAALDIQPVPTYPFKIGVDYKQQAYMALKGNVNLNVPPALQSTYPYQSISRPLPYPSIFMAGVSWHPISEVELDLAYTYEGWGAYRSDTFTGTSIDPTTGKPFTVAVQRLYKEANIYRLGAAWRVIPELEIRGGFFRDVTGVNTTVYNPSLPDSNVWAASFGLGYDFNKVTAVPLLQGFSVSAAFFYSWFDSLTSTAVPAPQGSGYPGTYDNWAWIATLGIQWRWDPLAQKSAN
jgi:long-chain fatty acid transport protein